MDDPTLYISMFLGLAGVFVLISSFSDDDDDNGGDGEKYLNNLEFIFEKVPSWITHNVNYLIIYLKN